MISKTYSNGNMLSKPPVKCIIAPMSGISMMKIKYIVINVPSHFWTKRKRTASMSEASIINQNGVGMVWVIGYENSNISAVSNGCRTISPIRLLSNSGYTMNSARLTGAFFLPRRRTLLLSQSLCYSPIVPANWKIGRYIEMTKKPTIPPKKIIITGSSALVRFSTAWSTSAS